MHALIMNLMIQLIALNPRQAIEVNGHTPDDLMASSSSHVHVSLKVRMQMCAIFELRCEVKRNETIATPSGAVKNY